VNENIFKASVVLIDNNKLRLSDTMKRILALVLVVLIGSLSAWYNPATPDILDARYDYTKCNVEYTKDWLSMREGCGEQKGVDVFDSSDYVDELDEGVADLKDAADEGDQLEFGTTMFKLGLDSLDLIGAIVRDAFDHKTFAFFSCVRDGEEPLMDARDECRADAMEKERGASKDYVQNELDYAEEQIDELEEKGADTSGMEQIIDYGDELIDDIDPAFDTGDVKEVRKLHLRHSRILLLFRLEKMLATIDYARPVIEDGNNGNKEEILERADELEEDIQDLLEECEYSAEVDDNLDYGTDNGECWADSLVLFRDFNSIQLLILEGIFE